MIQWKSITADNLIGFIYLEETPTKKPSSNTNNNTNKNNSDNNKKSSNTNLSSLTIDIDNFEFNPEITEYTLEVDYLTEVIKINATAEDDKSIVTGAGAKALKIGENHYSITITAEDGTTKEYKITIIRNEPLMIDHVETKIEDEPSTNYLIIGAISGGIILVIIAIFLIIRKMRKIKKRTNGIDKNN